MLWVAKSGISKQRVDSRQAVVAGAHSVVAISFEVVQEGAYERCVEVGEVELTGLFAGPCCCEPDEQAEGVPVGSDGIGAGPTLAGEAFGEKRLQCRRQGGHGRAPGLASRRAAARAISSGVADKYQ